MIDKKLNRRRFLIGGLIASASISGLTMAPTIALAAKAEIYTASFSSSAVGGYDTVAYFTQGKPVKGKKEHAMKWKEAWWYFASAENLAKFKADPTAFAPQFGGYCAYGLAQNATVKGDPLLWKIVDGKLYLNINKSVVKIWQKDIPGYIVKANGNWPKILQ